MQIPKRALVGLVVLSGAAYGCKDFLEEATAPQGQLDELTLQNRTGVEATLIGAYRMLGGNTQNLFGDAPSNWAFGSVASDDGHKGSQPGDGDEVQQLELYDWNAGGAQGVLNAKWRAYYEGVVRANNTLRLLKQVQTAKPSELTQTQANSIRGEALFLRAHFLFEAWKFWGSIPLLTEDDTEIFKPNSPSAEVVAFILKDLNEAAGLLAAIPRSGEKGRVTSWTAKAYKGRVQVYAGDYANGLTTLRDVANNGPYSLEPNFHRVWTAFTQFANGPETILAYNASVNDGAEDGNNGNYGERLAFPHSGSPFGCCGFHQPTQNLVNFFRVDANGLPLAVGVGDLTPLDATTAWNAFDAEFEAGNMAPVDPRLDWTVGRDGVPYKDWGVHAATWIRDPSYAGFYSPKKNIHEKASGSQSTVGWNAQHLNGVNMHIYRYADLLLLLAEAEVEVGSLDNARQIVNQIRARAGQVAQGPGTTAANIAVPINDPSITWANYRIGQYPTFPSKEFARTAVRYERRAELAMEGHRLFDLRRWGIAPEVLNAYVAVERSRRPFLTAAVPVAARHQLFPIPTTQIQLSSTGGQETLTQNPGW